MCVHLNNSQTNEIQKNLGIIGVQHKHLTSIARMETILYCTPKWLQRINGDYRIERKKERKKERERERENERKRDRMKD